MTDDLTPAAAVAVPLDAPVRPLSARLRVLRVLLAERHPEHHAAVTEAQLEIERLTAALGKANSQAEHFEREWYLRGDELERLRPLTICGCGDHFSDHDPGTCGNCVAAMTILPAA